MKKFYFIIFLLLISMFHVKHVSALDFSNIKYFDTINTSIGEGAEGVIDTRNSTNSSMLYATYTFDNNFDSLNGFYSDVIVFGNNFLVSNTNRTYQNGVGDVIGQNDNNVNYRFYIYQDSDTPTISTDIKSQISFDIVTNKGQFRCDFDSNGLVLCPYKLLGDDTTVSSLIMTFMFPNYVDHQGINAYEIFYWYSRLGNRIWFINYYNYDLENVETKLQNIYDLLNGKCEVSTSYLNINVNYGYNIDGSLNPSQNWHSTSDYYSNISSFKVVGSSSSSQGVRARVIEYDNDKNFIRGYEITNDDVLTLDKFKYYRFSLFGSNNYSVSVCSSGIVGSIDGINKGTQDINNSINDSNVSGGGSISDMSSSVADDSGIEDIFLLPVRLIQNVLNALNSNSCTPINLGSLYGTNLQMSCINLQNLLGSTIYNVIDIFFAFGVILGVRKYILEIFERISSLKEDNLID